jgi:hypothetical protein
VVGYLFNFNVNCLCHGSIFFLLLDDDDISQEQTKQLLPADLLSFARQSAMGMVRKRNAFKKSILSWLDDKHSLTTRVPQS